MVIVSRRGFLHRSAAVAGGTLIGPGVMRGLAACGTLTGGHRIRAGLGEGGYGPLRPSADCPELALPDGFVCRKYGTDGTLMFDGNVTPGAHDGMAAFALPNGNVRLVRNHEMKGDPATSSAVGNLVTAYDPKGNGGTTSLEISPSGERELVRDFLSLNGTIVNCAGGPTPWGSWLTCEETVAGARAGWDQEHGYIFEVPIMAEEQVPGVPLKAMGRFVHEAVAIDPATGIVYETEDRSTAGFYRFVPDRPGDLAAGGRLQILAVQDLPNYDTRTGQRVGAPLRVTWMDIDEPDPADAEANALAVYEQGFAKGGATFGRLEGCWYGNGSVFMNVTNGGNAGTGQVWEYRPGDDTGGELILFFESPGAAVLNSPDNVCISPRGGILLCEDSGGQDYVRGLTPRGEIFDFAVNLASTGEFAGATFSPDGQTLFVNVQSPGATYAIWGPWEVGAL
jgi:secreted PhoX family phosphatase